MISFFDFLKLNPRSFQKVYPTINDNSLILWHFLFKGYTEQCWITSKVWSIQQYGISKYKTPSKKSLVWDPLRPSRTETLHLRLTLLIMGLRHKYICISKFIHVQICICIYRKEVGILYLAFSVERKKDDSIVKKL